MLSSEPLFTYNLDSDSILGLLVDTRTIANSPFIQTGQIKPESDIY